MKCPICSAIMAQLLTSVYCPECDKKDDENDLERIDLPNISENWSEYERAFLDIFGFFKR